MDIKKLLLYLMLFLHLPSVLSGQEERAVSQESPPFLVVLGVAQDGGVPHAGVKAHKGWEDLDFRRLAVCLGIIDPESGQRWMIEATPDFREQLFRLDKMHPLKEKPGLDGILVTHAHIGHYTGLMFLGHESMGSREVPVYAMPRMRTFLEQNGPWDQLVRYKNIAIRPLEDGRPMQLNDRIKVTPFLVPHRQEYSEVVGFRIQGPNRSVLFIPDIDRWTDLDEQGVRIESLIESVDTAYLDGTFFGQGELPGRDMSTIPHPLIETSMKRFQSLPPEEKAKVRFIHLNHTNPALWKDSDARGRIEGKGFNVAEEMERIEL
ncbi:MAG: MBL fold metallo-hydrolase [Planctomycetota bacterium]|jgi:pyrroloquinoline quinone biosynthesis protein B